MGDHLRAGISSRHVTSQLAQLSLAPPGSLNRVPISAGVKAGMSPVGWQVTLWHVSSHSVLAG